MTDTCNATAAPDLAAPHVSAPAPDVRRDDGDAGSLEPGVLQRRDLESHPGQKYYLFVPGGCDPVDRITVVVHGISRNAEEQARAFAAEAAANRAVVVAPIFGRRRFPDYQRLGRSGRGARADLTLNAILYEVRRLTGATSRPVFMFGYSGGAQFVHRYAFAWPQQVMAIVLGAAGWYTLPDAARQFPRGLGWSPELPDLRFGFKEVMKVPVRVLVGDRDTTRDASLNRARWIDRDQGLSRICRARRWVERMNRIAEMQGWPPRCDLELMPGAGHQFSTCVTSGRMIERVWRFFGENDGGGPA